MTLEQIVQDAYKLVGCPACKGVRFKKCLSCGQETNSYRDFRDCRPARQLYETRAEWRAVEGEREQSVPDRPLQPSRQP